MEVIASCIVAVIWFAQARLFERTEVERGAAIAAMEKDIERMELESQRLLEKVATVENRLAQLEQEFQEVFE